MSNASAVRLADGRVAIVGGIDGVNDLDGVQVFDPASNSISTPWTLNPPISRAGVVLLADGRIFVGGGTSSGNAQSLAQILDPMTGDLQRIQLTQPLVDPSALLLPDDRVVLVGGWQDVQGAALSGEVYDPRQGGGPAVEFPLLDGRGAATATELSNGNIVLFGGLGSGGVGVKGTVELIETDGGRHASVPIGMVPEGRSSHTATLLGDGSILIAGGSGSDGRPLDSAGLIEMFAPAPGSSPSADPSAQPMVSPSASNPAP